MRHVKSECQSNLFENGLIEPVVGTVSHLQVVLFGTHVKPILWINN